MQDFRNLKVWQKAHAFVLTVYPATADFPQHELFGLRTQLRRASFTIPSKVAEGCARESDADFARSLHAAQGSASEAEYLLLAHDLGYLAGAKYADLSGAILEVRKMLSGLLGSLTY